MSYREHLGWDVKWHGDVLATNKDIQKIANHKIAMHCLDHNTTKGKAKYQIVHMCGKYQ